MPRLCATHLVMLSKAAAWIHQGESADFFPFFFFSFSQRWPTEMEMKPRKGLAKGDGRRLTHTAKCLFLACMYNTNPPPVVRILWSAPMRTLLVTNSQAARIDKLITFRTNVPLGHVAVMKNWWQKNEKKGLRYFTVSILCNTFLLIELHQWINYFTRPEHHDDKELLVPACSCIWGLWL